MSPVTVGEALTNKKVNRFIYILGATFLIVVGLGIWLSALTWHHNERLRILNVELEIAFLNDVLLTAQILNNENERLAQIADLQGQVNGLDHKLSKLEGKVDIIDSAVLGNQKRKARIIKAIGIIKKLLPIYGNPLPGCPKAPSPGELWSIAGAIIDNSDHYAVPASLIAAVIKQESAFCNTAVSSVGAKGYMQLMPDTAAQISADVAVKTGRALRTWRGRDNIELGTAYLSEQLMEFDGNVALAVAAYNAGPNHVKKVRAGIIQEYHRETANYMKVVPEFKEKFEKLGLQ